jgi:hypothetical protein
MMPNLRSPIEATSSNSGEFAAVSPSSLIEAPSPPPLRRDLPPPPVPTAFAASVATPKPSVPLAPVDEDSVHFQQVFEEYIALRIKCGESATSVAADKFFAKLRSNREQLMAKYNCRSARFSVYVKDGKAAIKATPVRS